jgi:hypothetical protein
MESAAIIIIIIIIIINYFYHHRHHHHEKNETKSKLLRNYAISGASLWLVMRKEIAAACGCLVLKFLDGGEAQQLFSPLATTSLRCHHLHCCTHMCNGMRVTKKCMMACNVEMRTVQQDS